MAGPPALAGRRAVCHVGATYVSEGFLYWTIQEADASPRLIDARDVGVSYFVVGIAGVLFYRIPRRWRWALPRRAASLIAVGALALRPNFTSWGTSARCCSGWPATR